jgi:ADP-ribose pyrophosphatase
MTYAILKSEYVFHGKVFNVRIDEVQKADGQKTRVDVVEHGGAVVILPIDEQGNIWFVDQYRYPIDQRLLELPAGTLDPGENPSVCAIRECREEIGMSPGQLTLLGEIFLAPGYSTEHLQIFLAQNLSPAPLTQDEDEDIKVRCLPVSEVKEWITQGKIHDAKTLAGLFLAFEHLHLFVWES